LDSGTRIGTEIAGYRIEAVLGRGGMSVVYLAEQMRLHRRIALKLLGPELAADSNFRERFMRESQVVAEIDHPNIIPIHDAGEAEGCLYIAMRYVDGPNLGQVLEKDGQLSVGRTVFILEQVASALDAAHAHGLVHRDVKPGNVLLVGDSDRIFLSDFGVAKRTTAAGLTRTGFFIGTPDFASPEQIEGRSVDARTDVYSLGGLLYACLTGMAPFQRDTEVAVMHAHLLEPPPKVSDARPELPRAFDNVLATAMAKASAERYASCGELAIATRAAALDRAPSAARVETQLAPPRPVAAEPPASVVPPGRVEETAAAPEPFLPSHTGAPPSAAPPHPEPVAATAAAKRPVGASRRTAIAMASVALLAAAASGAAVFFATRGDDSPPAVKAGASEGATMGGDAKGTEMEGASGHKGGAMENVTGTPPERLQKLTPEAIRMHCKSVPASGGAIAAESCVVDEEQQYGRTISTDVRLFASREHASDFYSAQLARGKIAPAAGGCGRLDGEGQGVWYHNPPQNTERGGRYFCDLPAGGAAVFTWDVEATNVVATASCSCAHPKLYSWWTFWVHELGSP